MSSRKATITIEVDVVADMIPGMMFTFDDHVGVLAGSVFRNSHYFTDMRVLSINEEGGSIDEETNRLEMVVSARNINKAKERAKQ